ncbi:MAG: hypothetical protein JRG76_13425 [Deltaproteobacteria bacterium]|nr:hypothetical protein [Deltaproteobacteria bacterium]
MGDETRGIAGRVLVGVAVLVNLILTILLIQQVTSVRAEVDDLTDTLATKQDVAMLRPLRVREILDRQCTTCHTDRRFAKALAMDMRGIDETVLRMQKHPGAVIPAERLPKIEAALLVFRCTACHGDGVLSQIVLMPREERVRFLRAKVRMPNSGFRTDQVRELLRAFEILTNDRTG